MNNTIKKKQIWVVPANEKNNDSPGQMLIVLAFDKNIAFVVPAHYYMGKRTFHDLILSSDLHSAFISGPLVVMTSLSMSISESAFNQEKACCIGEVSVEGFKFVEEKLSAVEKAKEHLALLRIKDAAEQIVTFEEDINAIKAGAYNILPVNGNIEEYQHFYHSVFDALEIWHIMAQRSMHEEQIEETFAQKVQNFVVRIKEFRADWISVKPALSGAGSSDDLPSSLPFFVDGIGSFSITFRIIKNQITMILEGEQTDEVLKRAPAITIVYSDGHQEKHTFSMDYLTKDIPIRETHIIRIDIEFTKED